MSVAAALSSASSYTRNFKMHAYPHDDVAVLLTLAASVLAKLPVPSSMSPGIPGGGFESAPPMSANAPTRANARRMAAFPMASSRGDTVTAEARGLRVSRTNCDSDICRNVSESPPEHCWSREMTDAACRVGFEQW